MSANVSQKMFPSLPTLGNMKKKTENDVFATNFLVRHRLMLYNTHLSQVHIIYRTTGASIQKAQAEFAQGAMANKTVQNAAVAGAQAAVQNTY